MKSFASLAFVLALAAAPAAFAQTPPAPAPNPEAAAAVAWLANNAKQPGVQSLPTGLQYKVVKSGPAGPSPKLGDIVKVNYEGALTTGDVFDSSFQRGRAAIMPLGALIPGWVEALPLMRSGDEWILYLPPHLAYGEEGSPPIPPSAVLVFRLQLLDFLSAD